MTSTIANKLAPLATPLPAGPTEDIYTTAQMTTLMAIMDAVIPSIQRASKASDKDEITHLIVSDEEYEKNVAHIKEKVVGTWEELDGYLGEKASDCPEFQNLLKRLLSCYVPEKGQKGLGFILTSLK